MAIVARSFNTHLRRWVPGEPISEAEDLKPHTYHDLASRGFIDAPKAKPVAPAKKSAK